MVQCLVSQITGFGRYPQIQTEHRSTSKNNWFPFELNIRLKSWAKFNFLRMVFLSWFFTCKRIRCAISSANLFDDVALLFEIIELFKCRCLNQSLIELGLETIAKDIRQKWSPMIYNILRIVDVDSLIFMWFFSIIYILYTFFPSIFVKSGINAFNGNEDEKRTDLMLLICLGQALVRV